MKTCEGCYDSFSGWWCDNCDAWPCTCLDDTMEETAIMKPLLLLDVDGPLNAYDGRKSLDPALWKRYKLNGYEVYLNAAHGPMLLAACETAGLELVWATTWEHDANDMIGCRIGLPKLPVIEWGLRAIEWKFNGVADYAAGRPLAWLDDDFAHHVRERAWFEGERGDTPTLLRHVDPTIGIVQADLDAVIEWAASLGAPKLVTGGWAFPVPTARKAHYFSEVGGRSLCRKYASFGLELERDTVASPDDCAPCRRGLDGLRGA